MLKLSNIRAGEKETISRMGFYYSRRGDKNNAKMRGGRIEGSPIVALRSSLSGLLREAIAGDASFATQAAVNEINLVS